MIKWLTNKIQAYLDKRFERRLRKRYDANRFQRTDMHNYGAVREIIGTRIENVIYEPDENDIPAWSLFRLVQIISEGMMHVNSKIPWVIEIFNPEHIFDNCIEMIGHLISTEHINRKYLNVKQ